MARRQPRFRIRPGATWSDGTAISVDDLRRTADPRFVATIDGPTPRGVIVVHFTQPLPGWRRLWSGLDAIAAPSVGVWGGPYRLVTMTPDLETVLRANPAWYGAQPKIDEVRLVLVPDAEVAARLLEAGKLDVIAPPAFSARTDRLERIKDAYVVKGAANEGGWTVALLANPLRLSPEQRHAVVNTVDVPRFVAVLLAGEAATATARPVSVHAVARVQDAASSRGAARVAANRVVLARLAAHRPRRAASRSSCVRASSTRFCPPTPRVTSTCWCDCNRRHPKPAGCARPVASTPCSRPMPTRGKPGAVAALTTKLKDDGVVVPLWRERPVVAARDGLRGVSANGFAAAGPAWNLETWSWTR